MKERCLATLKTECATEPFTTRAEERTTVLEYIKGFSIVSGCSQHWDTATQSIVDDCILP